MKAIVLAGSKGIGKGISDKLRDITDEIVTTSSSDLDTSEISQVKRFVEKQKKTDILVLNTGGPPAKDFFDITEDEWLKYYNQLFYSFVYILQNLHINDGGYIFLISSQHICCKVSSSRVNNSNEFILDSKLLYSSSGK